MECLRPIRFDDGNVEVIQPEWCGRLISKFWVDTVMLAVGQCDGQHVTVRREGKDWGNRSSVNTLFCSEIPAFDLFLVLVVYWLARPWQAGGSSSRSSSLAANLVRA